MRAPGAGVRRALRPYAVSRVVPARKTAFFPFAASIFPRSGAPAGRLRPGATWVGGRAQSDRVSDVSVGRPAPWGGMRHEAAGPPQRARNPRATRARADGTHRRRGTMAPVRCPAAAEGEPCRTPPAPPAGARCLTGKGPGVLSGSPKIKMKSGTCEPRGRPEEEARTVQASLPKTSDTGGRKTARASSAFRTAPARSLHPRCTAPPGGSRPEAGRPHDALRCASQAMPGGEIVRGTGLAVFLGQVPPSFGLSTVSEERVQ